MTPALVAAALGACWFLANGGGAAVPPGRVGWMLAGGDPAVHWLGGAFLRLEPWRWPLGKVEGLAAPLGTSVAMTDALPALALLTRALSPILPPDFQYFGAWLLACFALQGFFGARLAQALGARGPEAALAGALFALAPPLLRRVGHEALCAHWLLLAILAAGLRARGEHEGPPVAAPIALSVLAAAIHPTLATLCCGLTLGLLLHVHGWAARVRGAAALLAGTAAVYLVLGYGGVPLEAKGFGYFSADLLTLVNPMGWSRILPSWPTRTPGQWEGFAYLGAGGLALVLAGAGGRLARGGGPRARRCWPGLAAAAVAFSVFAVSTYVTVGGRKLFGTSVLPRALEPVVAPFRASGRFVWPAYYLLLAAGLAGLFAGVRRPAARAGLLAAAVALQAWELGLHRTAAHFADPGAPVVPAWAERTTGIASLALIPQRLRDADGAGCGPALGTRENALAYVAYRRGWTFNSAYVSRLDVRRARETCAASLDDVRAGRLRQDTVYVAWSGEADLLRRAGAACRDEQGTTVCVVMPAVR